MSSSPSTPLSIFFTGASGFIGGTVFNHLLRSPIGQSPNTHLIALVRVSLPNTVVINRLRQHKNVEVVEGSHDDAALVRSLTQRADVVIHTANSADDLPSIKAILDGLTIKDGRHRLLLHTSGSAEIADDARGEYVSPDSEIWTDLDFKRFNSLPDSAPHRDVDSLIINTAKRHPQQFDAILIAPPTIYGVGTGEGNKLSQQIPTIIRGILATGQGSLLGKGLNRWQSVHVEDLADLYISILTAALEKRIPFVANDAGLFFAAAGEFAYGDICREVTRELHKRGKLASPEITHTWTDAEVEEKLGKSAWVALGSNSRYISERAAKEGVPWNPKHLNAVLSTVESDVTEVLKRQGESSQPPSS